nr:MAG TPA: hypothetical protein [Caudoviricetes sp.]
MKKVSYGEYRMALEVLQAGFPAGCGVKICETGNSVLLGRPEVKLGVSWTHRDDMTPEETLRVARWMQLAADVAESFVYNGYRVVDEEEGA